MINKKDGGAVFFCMNKVFVFSAVTYKCGTSGSSRKRFATKDPADGARGGISHLDTGRKKAEKMCCAEPAL